MNLYNKVDTNLDFASREKEVENFWTTTISRNEPSISATAAPITLSMTDPRLPTVNRTSDMS